ncbi:hypothetical protein KIN20_031110 [Parelaphostrongylus tenuis]|uniref:Uncharacterized protein n=1 Tax=Parelaphostrongylus tenuis TaxID=148309 RepID=A0AAD5WH23_PARTN|nr:hypothetical protein KIN20_031110 [Parelaphostrongylus tenuis]
MAIKANEQLCTAIVQLLNNKGSEEGGSPKRPAELLRLIYQPRRQLIKIDDNPYAEFCGARNVLTLRHTTISTLREQNRRSEIKSFTVMDVVVL